MYGYGARCAHVFNPHLPTLGDKKDTQNQHTTQACAEHNQLLIQPVVRSRQHCTPITRSPAGTNTRAAASTAADGVETPVLTALGGPAALAHMVAANARSKDRCDIQARESRERPYHGRAFGTRGETRRGDCTLHALVRLCEPRGGGGANGGCGCRLVAHGCDGAVAATRCGRVIRDCMCVCVCVVTVTRVCVCAGRVGGPRRACG